MPSPFFVEKSPAAVAVAEIVDDTLSLQTLRYNHHSMKGTLEVKRSTLRRMADYLEPKRKTLKQISMLPSKISSSASSILIASATTQLRRQKYKPNIIEHV